MLYQPGIKGSRDIEPAVLQSHQAHVPPFSAGHENRAELEELWIVRADDARPQARADVDHVAVIGLGGQLPASQTISRKDNTCRNQSVLTVFAKKQGAGRLCGAAEPGQGAWKEMGP